MTEYRPAESVQQHAAVLIPRWHAHLVDVPIRYVFRDDTPAKAGKDQWGTARKVAGLNAYLVAVAAGEQEGTIDEDDFFVIEISEPVWALLSESERDALVDHELSHCWADTDDDGELKLSLRPHDVEEFKGAVERHGLWRPELSDYQQAVDQLTIDLYADA